jgi:hypothetical protein
MHPLGLPLCFFFVVALASFPLPLLFEPYRMIVSGLRNGGGTY